MSFLMRKPTPPPFSSRFLPIHWYPFMFMVSLLVRCVSVMAAMWVPWVCSAVVRLLTLLFSPLVLIVSILRFLISFEVLFFFPRLVLRLDWCLLLDCAWLGWCSSPNVTFFLVFSPVFFFRMLSGCCLVPALVSCGCGSVVDWFSLALGSVLLFRLLIRLLLVSLYCVAGHFRVSARYSDLWCLEASWSLWWL